MYQDSWHPDPSATSAMASTKAKLRRDCFIVPKGEVPSEVQGSRAGCQRGKQQKLKMLLPGPHEPTTRMQNWHSVSRTEVTAIESATAFDISNCGFGNKLTDRVICFARQKRGPT